MKRSIELYVKDMLEYMERAESYVESMNFDQFVKDNKTFDAVNSKASTRLKRK